ncbi:MAG: exo-alpha-sialidase [Armatimonadetes bacterium]|nr:exo-alpha-sialidase [Armatimonadota bacterium]
MGGAAALMLLSFDAHPPGPLPGGFVRVSGEWSIREVSRPERNRSAVAAVTSDRHVAFPGICKARSGALLVCYREGCAHASGNPDDGRIMLVRSQDLGETWSEPELAYDDPAMDDRNAAIACMDDGTIVLIWDKYLHGKHHWAWLARSSDEGRTWSEPTKMTRQENVHTRSRALDLGNGKWLLPWADAAHDEKTATWFSLFHPMMNEFEEIQATPTGRREVADEVAVTRALSGDLVALIRSPSDPELWQIVSRNDGRTWSESRLSGIPSQFTPCDLITLTDGRLLCSFSFRERRNERLVVSRDHGQTWDVEDSVDVFAGTAEVGGDRSYPASVQLGDESIGTVLYETNEPPKGGHIYFVRTPLAALSPERRPALYQGDPNADPAILLWPESLQGNEAGFSFRFTGRFGKPPNRIGLVMRYSGPQDYTAFEFQMGSAPDRNAWPINHVRIVERKGAEERVLTEGAAKGEWYDDGNVHEIGARRDGDLWTFTLDGVEQLSAEGNPWQPCGIVVTRAAVVIYGAGGR